MFVTHYYHVCRPPFHLSTLWWSPAICQDIRAILPGGSRAGLAPEANPIPDDDDEMMMSDEEFDYGEEEEDIQ